MLLVQGGESRQTRPLFEFRGGSKVNPKYWPSSRMMREQQQELSKLQLQLRMDVEKWRPTLAGLLGGGLSTLLLHPLDMLKTRQAVYGGTIKKHLTSCGSVQFSRKPGGLYSGVAANVLVSASSWGVYFATYDLISGGVSQQEMSSLNQFTCAFSAGAVTTVVTNPFSVVRSRIMCANKSSPQQAANYSSVMKAFMHIATNEGIRGFYKGLVPSMLGISHGTIQFMLYNKMKESWLQWNKAEKLSHYDSLSCCIASKLVAALTTYPCQNIRARQQAADQVSASTTKTLDIVRKEGLRGLYRGLLPNLLHVTPNVCIVFLIYEMVVNKQ